MLSAVWGLGGFQTNYSQDGIGYKVCIVCRGNVTVLLEMPAPVVIILIRCLLSLMKSTFPLNLVVLADKCS